MNKKRIIATLLLHKGFLVQSFGFKNYLPVGKLKYTSNFLSDWEVDELIVLDIDATIEKRPFDTRQLLEVSKNCKIPLTVGGGIKSIKDIDVLLRCGADRVVINSALYDDPEFIFQSIEKFGSQAIVGSIDYIYSNGNNYVHQYNKKSDSRKYVSEIIKVFQELGVSELLLKNVLREGYGAGYDIASIKSILSYCEIPIIFSGGAGNPDDFAVVFEKIPNVQALAASNLFMHLEQSPIVFRGLASKIANVRTENYEESYLKFHRTRANIKAIDV